MGLEPRGLVSIGLVSEEAGISWFEELDTGKFVDFNAGSEVKGVGNEAATAGDFKVKLGSEPIGGNDGVSGGREEVFEVIALFCSAEAANPEAGVDVVMEDVAFAEVTA